MIYLVWFLESSPPLLWGSIPPYSKDILCRAFRRGQDLGVFCQSDWVKDDQSEPQPEKRHVLSPGPHLGGFPHIHSSWEMGKDGRDLDRLDLSNYKINTFGNVPCGWHYCKHTHWSTHCSVSCHSHIPIFQLRKLRHTGFKRCQRTHISGDGAEV